MVSSSFETDCDCGFRLISKKLISSGNNRVKLVEIVEFGITIPLKTTKHKKHNFEGFEAFEFFLFV